MKPNDKITNFVRKKLGKHRTGVVVEYDLLPQMTAHMLANAERETKRAAEEVIDEARRLMELPKTGRWYYGHHASAPGEAPAIYTQELYDSLKVGKINPFQWMTFSDSDHAYIMEYGTPNGQIAPRPYFKPAYEYAKKRYTKRMLWYLFKLDLADWIRLRKSMKVEIYEGY